jgi:hypothetical protein
MNRYMLFLAILIALFSTVVGSEITAGSNLKSTPINEESTKIKDVEEYATDQGIDLQTAVNRISLQEIAGNLNAELLKNESETFAGLWVQHAPKFQIIVQFTKGGMEKVLPYIQDTEIANLIDFQIVNYSLKELETAQLFTQVNVGKYGVPIDSGINVIQNRVELFVINRLKLDSEILKNGLKLPPQVLEVTVNELSNQQTDIFAGLRLDAPDDRDCTSGFSVINSNGLKGIITAAHCDDIMSFNGIYLPFQGSAYGASYDFQWHAAPSLSVRSLVYDGTNNRYVFSTKHRDNQVINEFVCKYGWASGYTCGYIIDKNFNPGGAMNNTLIRVHRDGVNLSEGGDSGGPWFNLNTAYGLHIGEIGEDAYYMAINYIDFLGLSVLTNTIHFPIAIRGQSSLSNMTNPANLNHYPYPLINQDMTNPIILIPYPTCPVP